MIDEVFSAADVITCPEVLGMRLRPLTLWHVWSLKSLESPFVSGKPYDTEDICKAIMICGLRRKDYAELCGSENAIAALFGTIAADYLVKSKSDRAEVCNAFGKYLSSCTEFPEFYSSAKQNDIRDRLRCPSEWHIVASLLDMRICQTEDDAWDYPIARAQCWQAVQGERNGSKAYVDQRDRDDFEKLKAESNVSNQQ
jgi:hypothetical protein